MSERYSDAASRQRALVLFEKLEKSGDLRPAEKAELDALRGSSGADQNAIGETDATFRGALQGATFNLADEAGAAIRGYTSDETTYDAELADARAKNDQARSQFPDEFSNGELAGAGMSSIVPFGSAAKLGQGANLLGKTVIGSNVGGATGFAMGFGAGEDGFVNRSENAAAPTAVGAGIGAAVPGLAKAGGTVARRVLTPNAGRGVDGMSRAGSHRLMSALGDNPQDEVADYLSSLGSDAMLADVPGQMQHRAQGLASMKGEGGAELAKAIEDRAKGAGDRITQTADNVLGDADQARQLRLTQEAQRTDVASPLYDTATAHPDPLPVGDIANKLDLRLEVAGPSTRGKLQELRGEFAGDQMSAEQLHNIRSDLSDTIEEANRAGRKKQVAQLTATLKEIDGVLDTVPNYAKARQIYADSFEIERAITDGRSALGGGPKTAVSPADLRSQLADMKPDQREAFQRGVREYVYAQMGTARNAPATIRGELGKEWNREKIGVILGEDEANEVFQRLDAETAYAETRSKVTQGSQTQMRSEAANDLADLRDVESQRRPGPVTRLKRAVNDPVNSAIDGVIYGPGRSTQNVELGRALSATGDERDAIIDALIEMQARAKKKTKPEVGTERVLRALMTGGNSATSQSFATSR